MPDLIIENQELAKRRHGYVFRKKGFSLKMPFEIPVQLYWKFEGNFFSQCLFYFLFKNARK